MAIKSTPFIDQVTPLDHAHLQPLVEDIKDLYYMVGNLVAGEAAAAAGTVLPRISGDGIIRYVVNVKQDMLYVASQVATETPLPDSAEIGDRYFVAVLDDHPSGTNKYYYHLEIWTVVENNSVEQPKKWASSDAWAATVHYAGHDIVYTTQCWDRCTHDKLYICQNTNKCYYMNDGYGFEEVSGSINNATTDQSAIFMTETAEAAHTFYKGDGSHALDGWAGLDRNWFLRYKVVIVNFTVPTDNETAHGGPLLTVAFNPWFVINHCVFAPFTKPYGTWDDATPTDSSLSSLSVGALRIWDGGKSGDPDWGDDKMYFGAFIGTAWRKVWIKTLVGVADKEIH